MKTKQSMKYTAHVVLLLLILLCLPGCGKKSDIETTVAAIEDWPDINPETTAVETTPTPTTEPPTTAEPTTEFPKMGIPNYRMAMIDHAKIDGFYYSTYYLEFDQPGYYISDSTGKSKYYGKDNGNKYARPLKVFQWVEEAEGGQIHYKVAQVFASREQNKVPTQDLVFEVPVRYRYTPEDSAYIDTMTLTVNTPIQDITINNLAPNAPILLDGHFFAIDSGNTGLNYGTPKEMPNHEVCTLPFNYVRLSFEKIDFNSLMKHMSIARYDKKTKRFSAYTPPEGFSNFISYSEGIHNDLQYVQIGVGLSYPMGYLRQTRLDIKKELTDNMVLIYMENDKIVYYAYYE